MFRPLRAGIAPADWTQLRFPLFASPKLNGIRVLITSDGPKTRKLEDIPNKKVAAMLAKLPVGFDGEVTSGDLFAKDVFSRTQSMLMGEDGGDDFVFHVFDDFTLPDLKFYGRRERVLNRLSRLPYPWCVAVPQDHILDVESLVAYEQRHVDEGHEGVMLRSVDGPYKFGESTTNEGYLLKLKRFLTAEAECVGVYEQMRNTNELTKNKIGRAKRSSAKAGKVGKGVAGGLIGHYRHPDGTIKKIKCGGGIDAKTRKAFWDNPPIGKFFQFKYKELTPDGMPLFLTYLGLRDEKDIL
jgi:DNA ligase-1